MELFAQLLASGIVTGCLFAIIGVSFALIYGVTRAFHFAHVISYAAAAYVSWFFVRQLGWPLALSAVPAAIAAVSVGLCSEAIYNAIRKRHGSLKVILIASFGIFVVGQNLLQIIFGATALTYYPGTSFAPIFLGPVVINARDLLTVVAAASVIMGLHILLKTNVGRALRAVVDSERMAAVVGIDVPRTYYASFAIGSLLVVPAAMITVSSEGASPAMGLNVIFPAVAATVIGGVGSLRGAALAGFLLGLSQNLLVFQIGNQWQEAITFAVMILFFLYRPQGLFGRPVARIRV